MSGNVFRCHNWGGRTGSQHLVGGRPGVLFGILQSTGQPLQQRTIRLDISTAPRLRKPMLCVGFPAASVSESGSASWQGTVKRACAGASCVLNPLTGT